MQNIMPHNFFRGLLTVIFILSTASALAEEKLTMNMRDADIRAVIQWVADNTGRNIIVHKDVVGKVTVLSPQPLSPDEAYQVFLSVLQVHGYAAVETPEALKILPNSLAHSGLPLGDTSSTADMIVSVIKVNNLSAVKLAQMLRPMVSQEANLTPVAETNVLVVADHSRNIDHLKRLVEQLDRPGNNEIELVRLQHSNALDVQTSLMGLLANNANPEESQFLGISVDERSNSILLTGDPTRRRQLKKLIAQIDSPLDGQGNTQVVYLHYVKADELVPILKNLAQSIQKTQKDTSNGISIEASESANALVINAPPALLSTMKRVVEDLDIRRAQILVEALIVEVSGDIANDLGVQWVSGTGRDDSIVAGVSTLGDLDLVGNVVTDRNGDIISASPGRGFTFGYYNNGDLQAAIRALDQNRNANILSTPTIVAIDNEEASLLVGQNVPFRTGQATSAASDTTNPFVTIERQDIGISLVVTPRINRGDSITLDIKQKTESIAPSLDTAADIITEKREILTKALIRDDQILVLGGLISDEETEVKEKVPLLGDIPLFGRLFSSTSKNRTKKNLMVFIHPVILKDDAHIADVTQRRYQYMRELQESARRKEWKVEQTATPLLEDFETYGPAKKSPATGNNELKTSQ